MKTPFLHLVKRLATATPASWFPACLQEATGYTPLRIDANFHAATATAGAFASRDERLRARHIAACGALFAAPGYPPLGGLLILPASNGLSPVTAADQLRSRLLTRGRALLDAALADPRLIAHIDLGATPTSIAGAAGLQFLRDRFALAIGHFFRGHWPAGNDAASAEEMNAGAAATKSAAAFDATSVCVQIAGLPPNLVLWLAAAIADEAGAAHALILNEDDDSAFLIERPRPLCAQIH